MTSHHRQPATTQTPHPHTHTRGAWTSGVPWQTVVRRRRPPSVHRRPPRRVQVALPASGDAVPAVDAGPCTTAERRQADARAHRGRRGRGRTASQSKVRRAEEEEEAGPGWARGRSRRAGIRLGWMLIGSSAGSLALALHLALAPARPLSLALPRCRWPPAVPWRALPLPRHRHRHDHGHTDGWA